MAGKTWHTVVAACMLASCMCAAALDAMRKQLGLKIVKDEGDVPVFVVKAAHKPDFD